MCIYTDYKKVRSTLHPFWKNTILKELQKYTKHNEIDIGVGFYTISSRAYRMYINTWKTTKINKESETFPGSKNFLEDFSNQLSVSTLNEGIEVITNIENSSKLD